MLTLRALLVYPLLILFLRFIGRGLQFQSRPYDIAVQVLLGSAAANLIVSQEVSVWRAVPALGILVLMHIGLSFLSLWNPVKKVLVGEPATVIENGQILRANLLRYQISVEELVSALRQKGYHNLGDIEFAQLEPSGKLSVVPRSQARPVTPRDLKIATPYEGYTTVLVADGRVDRQNLEKVGLTEEWLRGELARHGTSDPSEVLFASLDTQGQLFVVRNQEVPLLQAIFKGIRVHTTPGLPPMVGGAGGNLPPPGPYPTGTTPPPGPNPPPGSPPTDGGH